MSFGKLEYLLLDECQKYPPDFEKIQQLIDEGADVNASDDDDNMLSYLFFAYTDDLLVDYLIKNGRKKEINNYQGDKIFDCRYLPQIVRLFLENGFDVNKIANPGGKYPCPYGGTALADLAYAGGDEHCVEVAKLLLDAGIEKEKMVNADNESLKNHFLEYGDQTYYCDEISRLINEYLRN